MVPACPADLTKVKPGSNQVLTSICYPMAASRNRACRCSKLYRPAARCDTELKEQASMPTCIGPHTGEFLRRCPLCGESIRCQDQLGIENGFGMCVREHYNVDEPAIDILPGTC